MSTESHICTKAQCFFCYEMNRLKLDKPIYKWPKTKKEVPAKKEKEEIIVIEPYNHTLKKSKKIIPQVKPHKVKMLFNNINLMSHR